MSIAFKPTDKCPHHWLIWIPDWGEGEEDARDIYSSWRGNDGDASDFEWVAEEYLDAEFSDFDYPSDMDFIVESPTGERRVIGVLVEAVPEFSGTDLTKRREGERYAEHLKTTDSEQETERATAEGRSSEG